MRAASGRRPTLGEHLDSWFEHGRSIRGWTPATLHGYRSVIETHLKPRLGSVRVDKITVPMVQTLITSMHAEGAAAGSIRNTRAVLSAALQWNAAANGLGANVARDSTVELPPLHRKKGSFLSKTEALRFIEAVRPHPLGTLFVTTLALGLRQSESFAVRWQDLDLDEGVLHVRQRGYFIDGEWHVGRTKTDSSDRVIMLPAAIVTMLREHRTRQLEGRLQAEAWADSDLVFTDQHGAPLHGPAVTRMMQRLMKGAGIEPRRYHDLRGSAGSLLYAMGTPLATISRMLGHSSLKVTSDIYLAVAPELQREAAGKVDAWMAGN